MAERKHNYGGHAFPTNEMQEYDGMTLWDYFAAHALSVSHWKYDTEYKQAAEFCGKVADAMIAEREKRRGNQ